jgi:hypothetical protein
MALMPLPERCAEQLPEQVSPRRRRPSEATNQSGAASGRPERTLARKQEVP